jgi:hypothetical protein
VYHIAKTSATKALFYGAIGIDLSLSKASQTIERMWRCRCDIQWWSSLLSTIPSTIQMLYDGMHFH